MSPKRLEHIVILCFERHFSKQNSVIRLKANILPPAKFLGWLHHCCMYKTSLLHRPNDCIGFTPSCPPTVQQNCAHDHMDVNRICSSVFLTSGPALLWYRSRATLIRHWMCRGIQFGKTCIRACSVAQNTIQMAYTKIVSHSLTWTLFKEMWFEVKQSSKHSAVS